MLGGNVDNAGAIAKFGFEDQNNSSENHIRKGKVFFCKFIKKKKKNKDGVLT